MSASGSMWVAYQPVIVGLGAVVVGTLGSTLLEWYRATLRNRHQATAMRRALIEELRQEEQIARLNSKRAGDTEDDSSLMVPIGEKRPFYDANISNIGVLRPNEIAHVVRAYGKLRAQVETLSVLGPIQRNEAGILHALVPSKWGSLLSENNTDLANTLNKAIAALSGNRDMPAPFDQD